MTAKQARTPPPPAFGQMVDEVLEEIGAMLKAKNAAYGNSALDPIRVRLDDKLSRLMRGSAAGEDVVTDLLGYLVLLRIASRTGKAVTA